MMTSKLNPLQLELLTLFADATTEEELKDIKHLLSLYYAEKAIAAADQVWEERQLSNDVMHQWMKQKMRVPYLSQIAHLSKKETK